MRRNLNFTAFNKGDTVIFHYSAFKKYDQEGEDVFKELVDNKEYTVKEVSILCLILEGVEGAYLKEHFQKIKK